MVNSSGTPVNIRLVEFATCLTIGCLLAQQQITTLGEIYVGLGIFAGLILSNTLSKRSLYPNRFFGPISWLFMIWFGVSNFQNNRPISQEQAQKLITENSLQRPYPIILQRQLNSPEHQQRFQGLVFDKKHQKQARVLVTYTPDALNHSLNNDQVIWTSTPLALIPGPRNPGSFDYQRYQYHQGIILQTSITNPSQILHQEQSKRTFIGVAQQINKVLGEQLNHPLLASRQRAIIKALLLGDKTELTPEIKDHFSASGAMHILALSGLHVGIILWLLNLLTWPLRRFVWGQHLATLAILIVLWIYALISGLSPSMVRAVTMVTFWAVGVFLHRPLGAINAVMLTYVVLLISNPMWLFSVGFQLSFLAILAILTLTPKMALLWKPKNRILGYFWSMTQLSFAAQFGVAPISIYYFHQFPGLFWLSNLILLPILAPIIGLGALIIMGEALIEVPDTIYLFFDNFLALVNHIIDWIALQENFIFRSLYISGAHVLGIYIGLTLLLFKKVVHLKSIALAILKSLSLTLMFKMFFMTKPVSDLTLFHLSKTTLMALNTKQGIQLFSSEWPLEDRADKVQKAFENHYQVSTLNIQYLPPMLHYNNQPILVIDQSGHYPKLDQPIVILTQNPPIHLGRLIEELAPCLILADGSNYRSQVAFWRAYCAQRNIAFSDTYQGGAIEKMLHRTRISL